MAQDLEKLIVKLDADLRSYERAMAKAQGVTTTQMRKIEREVQASATRVESSFARMGSTFSRFGKGLLIGLGIGTIEQAGRAIQELVSQMAKIGDLADKTGASTDAVQALAFGAVQADMSFDELDKTLLKFSKTLGEAANGQSDYLKTLRANGQELSGSFLQNLKQLADLVANAKNEQEALLIVTQAMGKGSDKWLEVLKKGSAGIDDLGRSAQGAGAVIDQELIKNMQVIDDQWAATMKSLKSETSSAVAWIITELQKLPGPFEIGAMARGAIANTFPSIFPAGLSPAPIDSPEMRRPAPGAGTVQTPSKIFNPEVDAAAKKKAADAAREAKRANDELTRSIERQFEAFTRNLTRTDEDVASLKLEAATMGLTTGEIERQRLAQELLNDANREGIPITNELNAVIQQKAAAYGAATQALEDLTRQQEAINEVQSAAADSLKGFITDIASGVEPIEALTDALSRLAEQILSMALDNLLQPGGAGGSGGLFGAIAALVKHSGGSVGSGGSHRMVHPSAFRNARRMHSGGLASDEVPAILQKGEVVLPKGFKMGGGGGYGRVVVNNYGGEVEQRQTKGPGGDRQLTLWFKANFHKELGSQSTQKSLQAGYGLRPSVTRR